jgi:6-phosphofructokinase 1
MQQALMTDDVFESWNLLGESGIMVKSLAVMTSGGDAPGMNAAIRAVVRRALSYGWEVFGVRNGYEGLVQGGEAIRLLAWDDVGGIISKGGTFLGTARSDRFRSREGRKQAVYNLLRTGIQALVIIGGDGSLMGAHVLVEEWEEHVTQILAENNDISSPCTEKLHVIGLPGSIDNDLYGTDMSIGADTALNHIIQAMDDLASTAASHQRTFVVETMGRHCGYLALMAALAGAASWVLVPEEELELRWHQKMVQAIQKAREVGRPHQMVIVAEGARHADGLPIRSEDVKKILGEQLNIDIRMTVLGHVQRGGSPTAFDRVLATRLGAAAVDILVKEPEVHHRHMLGIQKNVVVATPLEEVVNKSRAVRIEIEGCNTSKALELRGESFQNSLSLVKKLTRISPAQKRHEEGAVGILTGGADAPGMNTAVSVAARCLLNQGIKVLGVQDAFAGLVRGSLVELAWNELIGWVNRPGSEIGTSRYELKEEDFPRISETFAKYKIVGLVVIGGWGTYLKAAQLAGYSQAFERLNIPIVLVPANIDNNLPCTEFSIGADTALNNIIQALDKIRHTAGSSRRAFIVEVMGRQCGFLGLMGALASGSEKAYLPETGISLAELNRDVEILKESFQQGKRMVIYLRNENASRHYTTEFIRQLLDEESKGEFEVRTAVLGHLQRGGAPSAFDRILASRMGDSAASIMFEALQSGKKGIQVLGLRGRGIASFTLEQALQEMDLKLGRPQKQWFMDLTEIAACLAMQGPTRL